MSNKIGCNCTWKEISQLTIFWFLKYFEMRNWPIQLKLYILSGLPHVYSLQLNMEKMGINYYLTDSRICVILSV